MCRGDRATQLKCFNDALLEYGYKGEIGVPIDWFNAFERLKTIIVKSRKTRKVIFLDELPWMDTQKSKFLQALDLFWNKWCTSRSDIVLVVCGSAASWMVKNLIRNKGGLHNRITCKLHLQPFTLSETAEYLKSKGIRWNNHTIAECYMIMGGIPFYLHHLNKSMSLAQNIDRIFFNESALLEDEFSNLYDSLFTHSDDYIRIVRTLAQKKRGLTRDEIATGTKISNGGGLTRKLEELEQCGFIRKYEALGSTKSIYQLVDFYTLFYYQFLHGGKKYDEHNWMHLQGENHYNTWMGLSFERLCFAHTQEIKRSLGISGIGTKVYGFATDSAQIDMVIERADKFINLCEMKFTTLPYSITKVEWAKLQNRIATLHEQKPSYSILVTMVTSGGLKQNEYSSNAVQSEVRLDDLFL